MLEMSSIQDSLQTKLDELECHFTWDIKQDDLVLTNVLDRLEEQAKMDQGSNEGVARTHCSLGYLKFLLGHKEEALTHLLKSETLNKEKFCDKALIVTYGNFAWINYHMENYTECESYLKKLQKINETFPAGSSSVPEVLGEKGWAYLKFSRKYYKRAVEAFQKAVELDPENSEWNAGYATALYRIETDRNETGTTCTVDSPAIRQLRQAIEINPDDDSLKVLLGLRLFICSKNLNKESEKLMETALNGSPENPRVIRYVGKFFRNQGSVDRSIDVLKTALEKSPNSGFIHHQLAICYKNKKISLQKEKRDRTEINNARNHCIDYLEKATSLKASFIIAMSELALQYGERRELSKAEELFSRTFETAREKNESIHVVHYCYGEFQQYSNRREDLAIEHYKKCLKMNPDASEANRSAYKLMTIAQKRIKVDPSDWKANEILGFIYQMKGEMFGDTKSYAGTSDKEEDDECLSNLFEINCKL